MSSDWTGGYVQRRLADLPIPKKLALIIAIPFSVVLMLLALSVGGFEALSGIRAYVGGEGLYSKAQKDAVNHLDRYARSGDPREYEQFERYLAAPLGDQAARLELEKPDYDYAAAARAFEQGRNDPGDIPMMIIIFRWGRHVSYVDHAIAIWAQGDVKINALRAVGAELHREIASGSPVQARVGELLGQTAVLNAELTRLEDDFSSTLGEAARWLKSLLLLVMLQATLLASLLGIALARAVARRLIGEIDHLKEATTRVAHGDFSQLIAAESRDEIGQLATLFGEMAALRKQAEDALARRLTELAAANARILQNEKLKSDFFSNISHEFRTPLTLIMAPLDVLLSGAYGPIADAQRSLFESMQNNAVRLLQMVQGLLDFQKLEARKIEVTREAVDVIALTRSIWSDFLPLLHRKGLDGHFECEPDSAVVGLDRYLFERIAFNLIANAVKFTEQGTITVALMVVQDRLRLEVHDTGIGIPESEIPHLFEKFRQIEASATRRFEGSGLGLALVEEFAALLDGDVSVLSQLGQGSVFTFRCAAPAMTLPEKGWAQLSSAPARLMERYQSVLPAAPRAIGVLSPKPLDEEFVKEPPGDGHRILVAEDNSELASYIAYLLRDAGEVRHAADGEEALSFAYSWLPHIVISDIMMPRRDGLSLCRELKADPRTRSTPIILLTALTYREALLEGWEAGADDYLFKPFHPEELQTRVRTFLSAIDARAGRVEAEIALEKEGAARKQAEEAIVLANERLQTLSRRLLEIQETERRQIARELHDEVGQALTATKINLQSLQRYPDPATIAVRLGESVGIVERALGQVQSLSLALRPPLLDDLGLAAALRWLLDQHTRRKGLHVEFREALLDKRFDPAVETACFRVGQEAINNIVRHACARSVILELEEHNGALHLRVSDDGSGFDVPAARRQAVQGASLGLLSMEERATLAGGGIEWRSTPGQGAEVHAWFPRRRPAGTTDKTQATA